MSAPKPATPPTRASYQNRAAFIIPGTERTFDRIQALRVCPAVRMAGPMATMIPNALEGCTALIHTDRCIGCGICVRNDPEHLHMLEW